MIPSRIDGRLNNICSLQNGPDITMKADVMRQATSRGQTGDGCSERISLRHILLKHIFAFTTLLSLRCRHSLLGRAIYIIRCELRQKLCKADVDYAQQQTRAKSRKTTRDQDSLLREVGYAAAAQVASSVHLNSKLGVDITRVQIRCHDVHRRTRLPRQRARSQQSSCTSEVFGH